MNDVLEKQITGGPVMVAIAGIEYPLEYRMAAVIAYKERSGDSLFNPKAWSAIDLRTDPAKWLACLWAGLHQRQADKSWKSPLSFEELSDLIGFDFEAATAISAQVSKALASYFPKREPASAVKGDEVKKKEPEPVDLENSASPSSGPSPVSVSVSAATSS